MKLFNSLKFKIVAAISMIVVLIIVGIFAYISFYNKPVMNKFVLNDPNTTYSLRTFTRGSDCGAYINGHLLYDYYGKGFGSIRVDGIEDINKYLKEGDNKIELKIISKGKYFDPGDDYECSSAIFAKDNNDKEGKRIAFLNIKYAGIDQFTMGSTLDKDKENFYFKNQPILEFNNDNPDEKTATLSVILHITNIRN